MDKGPWVVHKSATGVWHVCSDDLTHDVTLEITGDFWTCEEKKYTEWLANELNDCATLRAKNEHLLRVRDAVSAALKNGVPHSTGVRIFAGDVDAIRDALKKVEGWEE